MNDAWRLLSWDYVCDQSWDIRYAHEQASDRAEYGVNFYEFIHTCDKLYPLAQKWWDGLPAKRRHELLADRANELKDRLASVESAEELARFERGEGGGYG